MDYGALSLLPPLIAIILALWTKEVILSLFLAIFAGEIILHESLSVAFVELFEDMVSLFAQGWITKTLLFAVFVGSIINLIVKSGGVEALVETLTHKRNIITNKTSAMLLAYFIGVIIFIESSITSLLAGTIARPFTDKYGVSREKLAYICDSTSAPICTIIPLNGWGALLIGLITVQISTLGLTSSAVSLLFESILYNFYSWITLGFVLYIIISGKDFSFMKVYQPVVGEYQPSRSNGKIINMLLPITLLIIIMPIGLYISGDGDMRNGSGSTSVFYAVMITIIISAIYYRVSNIFTTTQLQTHIFDGASKMLPIVAILVFAFLIGDIIKELGSGNYIASLLDATINPIFLPHLIFLFSGITAFSTGTSWGTFSIMVPIAISVGVVSDINVALMIGAAISGGVFGDHASPISDTTIISSMAAECDHINHVKSQLPYALTSAFFASVVYIIVGYFSVA